ncbi:unnamed protein product [Bemisia tabaci]|uniref:Fork-head domain-containing protein n=1 Tax=Bemisia tabaci TaxID=7038 RepID=A0A9P0F8A2_BEMTA|nr:unnamed protein product [Bemisia tabaci]
MAPEKPLVSEVEHAVAMVQNGALSAHFLTAPNKFNIKEEFEIEVEATAAEVDFTQTGCLKQESTDNSNNKPGKSDDDLTSLSWLQDKNLLKGIKLRPNASASAGAVSKTPGTNVPSDTQESPTSDFVDDSASDSTCSSVNSSSPTPMSAVGTPKKHPHHIPYDPKIHVTSKPPYSFSCLIFMAIDDSSMKALPVKEIYNWILEHFPFYRNAPTGWKNSVRHNLSLNKCFTKVEKAPNLGKGSLWMVDPNYRPNLVQAITKTPNNPYKTWNVKQNRPLHDTSSGSSSVKQEENDCIDDVDAATAMITLKHNILLKSSGERPPIVTSCPSADHNYIVDQISDGIGRSEPTSSDEAFADGTDSDHSGSALEQKFATAKRLEDAEEQRKIAEGADALLNLAGAGIHYTEVASDRIDSVGIKRKRKASLSGEEDFTNHPKVAFKPRIVRNSKVKSSSSPNKWKNFTDKEADYVKNKWKPFTQSSVLTSNIVSSSNSESDNNNTILYIESNSGSSSVNRNIKVKRKLSSAFASNDAKNR